MIEILEKGGKEIKIDFSQMEGKNVLITGASGLIGISMTSVLKNIKGVKLFLTINNDSDILIKLISNYSCDKIFVQKIDLASDCLFYEEKMDYIIHAACYGQPGKFMENQFKTIRLNTIVVDHLISKNLNENGKFLFISSSELYSGLECPPFKENQIGTTDPFHPRACYIESKRLGETICNVYRNLGIDVKIGRVCLTYGPGTKIGDRRVLNNFIEKALVEGHIIMMDSGKAMRTYSYILDTVENLFNILLFGKEVVYNVGGNSRLSIAELAKKIGDILNVSVSIPETPNTMIGAPDDVFLDLSKTQLEFDKSVYMNIDEGLRRTIQYQKKLYNK